MYHVEPVLQLVEGCVCEEGFASRFGIAVEEVHFCFGITFGQDGYVYAVLCRTASMQVAVRGDVGQSALVDEDIIGVQPLTVIRLKTISSKGTVISFS